MAGYGDLLSKLATGGGGPSVGAPPAAMGVGLGAPPSMPGMPPAPTGVGAMPVGDPSTTKKVAASQAVMALRELKGHYPALSPMLDSTVDAIKGASSGDKPSAPPGEPQPPGSPTPDLPPAGGSPGP